MSIKDLTKIKKHLFFCNGGTCKKNGAGESTAACRSAIAECGLTEEIHSSKTLCNGRCNDGPIVIAMPEGIWFKKMTTEKASSFVREFLLEGRIFTGHLLYRYGEQEILTDDHII